MPKIQPTVINETLRQAEEWARRASASVPEYLRRKRNRVRRGSTTLQFLEPHFPDIESGLDVSAS